MKNTFRTFGLLLATLGVVILVVKVILVIDHAYHAKAFSFTTDGIGWAMAFLGFGLLLAEFGKPSGAFTFVRDNAPSALDLFRRFQRKDGQREMDRVPVADITADEEPLNHPPPEK